MLVGIMSDTHDHVWRTRAAIESLKSADVLLHCGDLCSPFVAKLLGEMAQVDVHIVWGNNEGDRTQISKVASSFPNLHLHGPHANLEFDGMRVGLNHYPAIAHDMAASGKYDLVCYGHDHILHQSVVTECTLINPGEVLGMKGRSTVVTLDTTTLVTEVLDLA